MFKYSVIFLGLTVCIWKSDAQCSMTNPCKLKGTKAKVPIPFEYVSVNGEVQINLTVDVTKLQLEWFTYWRRTYNGQLPGPTWRVKQGDRIKVTLKNNLSLNQPAGIMNEQRHPNSTNLHTHGLHVSPNAPGDHVFTSVGPGMSQDYIFDVDSENPPGTYWYHPHLHGSTFFQVQSSMAGIIIVEDPVNASTPAHIQAVSCPNNCKHDIPLLFQPTFTYWSPDGKGFVKVQREIQDDPYFRTERFKVKTYTLGDWLRNSLTGPYHFSVNGELWPTLDFSTGVTKRFRMVNAGGSSVLELAITDAKGYPLNGECQFLEIAVDGVYLDKAVKPPRGRSFLMPATRIDWLVVCDKPGMYQVRSIETPGVTGDSLANAERLNDTLFYLNVTGNPTPTTILQTSLPQRPWFVRDFQGYTQDQVQGRHVIEIDPKSTMNRLKFQGKGHPRFKVDVNSVQEWYIINTNQKAYHPIHIHINHFQVISFNKYTGPVANHNNGKIVLFDQTGKRCYYQPPGYTASTQVTFPQSALNFLGHENRWLNYTLPGTMGYSRPGVFRDTIHVPPMANITIRFMAHKYTGTGIVHCHILKHEDKGMMYGFAITQPGSNITVYEKAGNGYPGQCLKCDPFPFNQVVNCGATSSVAPTVSIPKGGNGNSIAVGANNQNGGSTTTSRILTTSRAAASYCAYKWTFIVAAITALTSSLLV